MANEHFIISTLNLPENRIKVIQVFKISGVFYLTRLPIKQKKSWLPILWVL